MNKQQQRLRITRGHKLHTRIMRMIKLERVQKIP